MLGGGAGILASDNLTLDVCAHTLVCVPRLPGRSLVASDVLLVSTSSTSEIARLPSHASARAILRAAGASGYSRLHIS